MSLSRLNKKEIKALTFRRYSVPELLPCLALISSTRCRKNFRVNTPEFYYLIIILVLTRKYGYARQRDLVKIAKTHRQNINRALNYLEYVGYIVRVKRKSMELDITDKGMAVFAKYQRLYMEQIVNLREFDINFEEI